MTATQEGSGGLWACGYTLVELVFALAIFAILAAIALPNWSTLVPDYNLKGAARQVQSELHRIKSRAVSEKVSFQLVFSPSGDNYTVQRDDGSTTTTEAIKPLPEGIDVRNSVTLGFKAIGRASSSGTLKLCNNKGVGYNIALNQTGRVRICTPSSCDGDC